MRRKGVFTIGLLDFIFKGKKDIAVTNYFKTLSGYQPVFNTYRGGVYEMELTRSAIHTFAKHCSKLKPEITGAAGKYLEYVLQFRPNKFMDTTKFIYRLATILKAHNTAFVVPVEDNFGDIIGYYPPFPLTCEILDVGGVPWLRYTFANGQRASVEFEKVGILTQFQYRDDFFGEDNAALSPTMQLLHTQNQGIINGVKNSANIRFMARLTNILKPEDIKKERDRFAEDNLSAANQSGMVIFDNKFGDFKQIESKPFIANPAQMKQINDSVYNYFGVNEAILQNKYTEDEWGAYYEGEIEPFAIQLSLVMSNMTFTAREIAHGNKIFYSANRLQYATNSTKLNVSTQLFDRGLLNMNGAREIWNMPTVPDGEKYYIRKEYAEVSRLGKEGEGNADKSESGVSEHDDAAINTSGSEAAEQ